MLKRVKLYDLKPGDLLAPKWKSKTGGRLRIKNVDCLSTLTIVGFDDDTATGPVFTSFSVTLEVPDEH